MFSIKKILIDGHRNVVGNLQQQPKNTEWTKENLKGKINGSKKGEFW